MDNYTATEMAYKNGYEQGKPRWISVKERLPEENIDVLTYRAKTGYVEVSHRMKWRWWSHSNLNPITHWMPLPEPPKEGE